MLWKNLEETVRHLHALCGFSYSGTVSIEHKKRAATLPFNLREVNKPLMSVLTHDELAKEKNGVHNLEVHKVKVHWWALLQIYSFLCTWMFHQLQYAFNVLHRREWKESVHS